METTKKQAKKSLFILLLIMLIGGIYGTAEAKSLYVIDDHHTAQFDAYKINPDGTITNQVSCNLVHATDPAGIGIWVEPGKDRPAGAIFITSEFSMPGAEIWDAKTMTYLGTVSGALNQAGIDVDSSNNTVYSVERNTSNLFVYDWDPNAQTLTPKAGFNPFILPSCSGAFGIAVDDLNDILWVADSVANVVRAYDINDLNDVTEDANLSFTPSHVAIDVAVDRRRDIVYTVSMSYGAATPPGAGSNLLSKYDLATSTEITGNLGCHGVGVTVDDANDANGYVYVTVSPYCTNPGQIQVWDTCSIPWNKVQDVNLAGSPAGISVPKGNISYKPPIYLTKNDLLDDCVGPGDEIIYTISYGNTITDPCDPKYVGTVNDVNIIDYLPPEVDFNSASGPNCVQPDSNTVVWHIGTLHPGDEGFVTLKVNVKPCIQPCSIITNECVIESNDVPIGRAAYEYTPVCCPTLTKEDNVPGSSCVVPDVNITYNICYAANGYGDTNVVIIDDLPPEVNFVWASNGGEYNESSRTVTWDDIDFPPNAYGCVELIVKVNYYPPMPPPCGGIVTNCCEMTGDCIDVNDCEDTPVCCCRVIYVDIGANGLNNGTSWEDAYINLQDALEDANISPDCVVEIRVAEGIYIPSEPTDPCDERTATFELINCVKIKGGYAGFGEPEPDARNINKYETILSGDLKGNDRQCICDLFDLLDDPCRDDNSYHVVTGSGTNEIAVLDGFIVTGGNADGASPNDCGGGMYIVDSNTTVTNCTFRLNLAFGYGGGLYNNGSPIIANCLFKNNQANDSGGGIYGSAMVTNCAFVGNLADSGGGIYSAPQLTVTNCTFVENESDYGDGIYVYGTATVTNCILWGNGCRQIFGDAGNANVSYSDIQGGWTGVGNIDADPMFEPDGYHLTLCSPCIDAGDPHYITGEETDIDGEQRIMNGNCNEEAIVDMGADEYYIADCNFLYAHCPEPIDGATDVPRAVVVSWRPGIYAADVNGHRVYLDPSRQKVIDRSGCEVNGVTTTNPCYNPGILDLGTTYHWAVDEVNGPNIWRGDVWNFVEFLLEVDIDAFGCAGPNDTHPGWTSWEMPALGPFGPVMKSFGYNPTSCEIVQLAAKTWDGNNVFGGSRNRLSVDVSNPADFARMYKDFTFVPLITPGIGMGLNYIKVDFLFGENCAGKEFEFTFWSWDPAITGVPPRSKFVAWSTTNPAEWLIANGYPNGYFPSGTDSNMPAGLAALVDGIALQHGTAPWLSESDVAHGMSYSASMIERLDEYSHITYYGWADMTTMMGGNTHACLNGFAIGVPKPECTLTADLTGDCVVDYLDLKIMTDEWLDTGCCEADLYKDCKVDFKDFAILADSWLVEGLWP
jgi:predicted outer membrane repeat protein